MSWLLVKAGVPTIHDAARGLNLFYGRCSHIILRLLVANSQFCSRQSWQDSRSCDSSESASRTHFTQALHIEKQAHWTHGGDSKSVPGRRLSVTPLSVFDTADD